MACCTREDGWRHGAERTHLAREQQLGPVLLAHVDQLESVALDLVQLFINFRQIDFVQALYLEERLLEHALHRRVSLLVEVSEPRLLIRLKKLQQQVGSRLEIGRRISVQTFAKGLANPTLQRC